MLCYVKLRHSYFYVNVFDTSCCTLCELFLSGIYQNLLMHNLLDCQLC